MSKRISASDEQIKEAALTSLSGAAAAVKLGIKYDTFRVHAKRLGVFFTNQSGKGISKSKKDGLDKFPLQEIFDGKHPQYQSNKLRKRMFSEKIKQERCECCGASSWLGKKLSIKRDNPNRRKAFRSRHSCDDNPGPKWKARYWSSKCGIRRPVSHIR